MAALEKRLEIDLLQQTDTMIYFKWSSTGDTCVVKRDADAIYTGIENSFKDENLQSGELYTYTVERLDEEGEVKERIKMQTSTEDHTEDSINYLQQIAFTTIVSDSKIILAWGAIDGIDEYEIYRDGEFLDTIKKTQFTDRGVEMDREYSYWIRAKRPLEKSETGFSEEKSVAAHLFGFFNIKSSQEAASMEEFWITKKIAPLERLLADSPQVNVSEFNRVWDFRYTTFLSDKFLANPNLLSLNRYFAGDNRTFTPDSSHYRTQVNFSLQLGKEDSALELQKDVGMSVAYDWRKKFRKADVASSEGIQLEKVKEDERNVKVILKHSVGNPLTTSPNIDYDVSATFYRDGHYDIVGLHDQAPNHEVYLKNDKMNEWLQIHEAESKGLAWMSRSIASQYWRISNFE
ncbi:DUF3238 domain-containing protein [Planococcus shenhongbingii]|uniref:DUF3238 domain-containing protein n=1 Tax=Planococcus shenhongbingii TaxID=3058398 RepID=UPI00260DEC10|nr:DUF3238 domain-containing protein [Planococcus sp. N016]WKA58803.1 DUF3238 domain-containing protein [Planococcus sp. N016]